MTWLPRALMMMTVTIVLSGCAARPEPVVVVTAPPPPPPPVVSAPMPAGTWPGMPVPALLADGSYATPNRDLSPAAAVWHLRGALNFAALGCRGASEGAIIGGYNAMLAAQKPVLAAAERNLLVEYRATAGTEWRDAYDDAMTRLYNYYAFAPARAALCDTAVRVLTDAQTVSSADFPAFATARLPDLDRSFTDVFRAYDAWTKQRQVQPTYAVAANTTLGRPTAAPWIEVDPSVLRLP